jgi:hypothetical protein
MSGFYENEDKRKKQVLADFQDYDLNFIAAMIAGYTTDGDMRWRDMFYALLELKWEIGALGAEPLFQAGWYYTASMREALSNLLSNLPCFIIYIVGEHFKTFYCETEF